MTTLEVMNIKLDAILERCQSDTLDTIIQFGRYLKEHFDYIDKKEDIDKLVESFVKGTEPEEKSAAEKCNIFYPVGHEIKFQTLSEMRDYSDMLEDKGYKVEWSYRSESLYPGSHEAVVKHILTIKEVPYERME